MVESVGEQVNQLEPGDYVIPAKLCLGTWQSFMVGDQDNFIKLPFPKEKLEKIIETQGIASLATLNSNVATAFQVLSDPSLKPGDVVCQSSSNGFLGRTFIQIAKLKKLKTVNFVRKQRYDKYLIISSLSKELLGELESLGSSLTLSYEDATADMIIKSLGSLPVLALTSVGGDYFNKILSVMAENAIIYSVSSINRDPIEVNIQDLIFKQVAIKGFWISKWYQKNNYIFDERLNMLREILQLYFEKKLTLPKHSLISINDDLEGAFSHSKGIKQVFLF